ncbi:UNVERIFIED_CONTAM: hypothetical protein H355_014613 [Colinus virginianus]|nr:hypothetical protein H355_014613 [Colinus virginianus]
MEEILKTHIAHWWSPDGTRLAYATINASRVPTMEIPVYTGSLYPTVKTYHYPKAGMENPTISLHVIGLNGPTHDLEMTPPDDQRMRDYYITMVKWATSTKVAVNWLNRAQNFSILTLCDATTGVCTKPNSSSDNLQSITSGDWDVTKILAYDEKRHKIKVVSKKQWNQRGSILGQTKVPFGPVSESIGQVTVEKKKEELFELEVNENVQLAVNDRQMPKVEYMEIKIDDYKLPMQILKPATFSDMAHYPLLLVVDGTPGNQIVTEKFEVTWESVMVSLHNAIVLKFDGRGSGFQGTKLLHEDYGGYLSTYMLPAGEENQVFACGAALSPLTDFKLYASAFSERYLGLHGIDNRAYEITKLAHRVSLLKEQTFLIIHATADEKIHFQHTADLITHLIRAKANYSLQIYPDESHYFSNPALEQHLYNSIVNFFASCFQVQDKLPIAPLKEEEDDD